MPETGTYSRRSRIDALVFLLLLIAGLATAFGLKPPLYTDAHALGMHAVALIVPSIAATAFAVWAFLRRQSETVRTGGALVLFACLSLPFVDLWSSPIVHHEGDDSVHHSTYAHHLVEERTLWGGDTLVRSEAPSRAYYDQPGYRYYLAAMIAALGGEHRGLQLANMGVLLVVVLVLLRTLLEVPNRHRTEILAAFVLASAPYAALNVLGGYGEWLTVALFGIAASASVARRHVLTIVALALVPFLRQNLLPISVLLAAFTILSHRRWELAPVYVALVGLPVYHNLHYAGQFQFFVANTGGVAPLTGHLGRDMLMKAGGYFGYMPGEDLLALATAAFFAPLATLAITLELVTARSWGRVVLLGLVLATILPTLLFGSGSYPRFEFVNLWAILLSLLIVRTTPRQPFKFMKMLAD